MTNSHFPTISVVIPAYNSEQTIVPALESVYNQTIVPHEVILVDDGSSDATVELVKNKFAQVKIIQQSNSGPSAARNRGVQEASGQWIAFLDADDIWHPQKTQDQMEAVANLPHVVLVATDWVRLESQFDSVPSNIEQTLLDYRQILILNRFQTSTVIVKKDILEQAGGFKAELDGAEDWDTWLRVAVLGEELKLDWAYVMYRNMSSSYSKDLWRVFSNMVKMLEREQDRGILASVDFNEIMTWHYLRFCVAFILKKDWVRALGVWQAMAARGLLPQVSQASRKYLVPFLGKRLARRIEALDSKYQLASKIGISKAITN